MGKLIILIALATAGIILVYFKSDLEMGLRNLETPIAPTEESIVIMHSFKDGIHLYRGEIRLPHSCYGVAVDARRDSEYPSRVIVALMTRDGMTDDLRMCLKIPTRYPFETIAEAPESATLILRIDGKEVPTRIIEAPWRSPKRSVTNLETIL